MKAKVRIVLAEDHTILREGLRALLTADPDFEIIGEAADGRTAVRFVEKQIPDLILMDLSMPRMTGMDAIREIKKRENSLFNRIAKKFRGWLAVTNIPILLSQSYPKSEVIGLPFEAKVNGLLLGE